MFWEGTAWTYADFWERTGRVAYALLTRTEFRPQQPVGLLGRNNPDMLLGYIGILRAGGVAVPLNFMLKPEEIKAQLGFVDARYCLVGDIDKTYRECVAPEHVVVPVADLNATSVAELPTVTASSRATILLTSGSTGAPKGVLHTQGSMLHAALLLSAAFPFSQDDVNIAFLPFFASIPEQVLPTLVSGGALDVLPRFDVEAICRACERATAFDAVPTLVARLLAEGDPAQLNRLRWIMFASEPMPPAVLQQWQDAAPAAKTYEFYGMTELLTISHATPDVLRRRPDSVGFPFATSSLHVIDEQGEVLPPGVAGEIVCKSPALMAGYLNDEIASDAAFTATGALRTGDVGVLDDTGCLSLTGRSKDIIISGGLNVAPAEIEAVACRHPQVACACVIGIPHARWGETPVVVAMAKPGSALTGRELAQFCRTELAGFKRPSAAAIVGELPLTGIGKAARSHLRDAILQGSLRLEHAD